MGLNLKTPNVGLRNLQVLRDAYNFRHVAAAFCYFGVELPTKSPVNA